MSDYNVGKDVAEKVGTLKGVRDGYKARSIMESNSCIVRIRSLVVNGKQFAHQRELDELSKSAEAHSLQA